MVAQNSNARLQDQFSAGKISYLIMTCKMDSPNCKCGFPKQHTQREAIGWLSLSTIRSGTIIWGNSKSRVLEEFKAQSAGSRFFSR